jgi:hypothetical protein
MKYDITNTKDVQQPATSVKSIPQNRWVMSSIVTELKRSYFQSEESITEIPEADNKALFLKSLPVRRKSWIPWPKF